MTNISHISPRTRYAYTKDGSLVIVKTVAGENRTITLSPKEEREMFEYQTIKRQPFPPVDDAS